MVNIQQFEEKNECSKSLHFANALTFYSRYIESEYLWGMLHYFISYYIIYYYIMKNKTRPTHYRVSGRNLAYFRLQGGVLFWIFPKAATKPRPNKQKNPTWNKTKKSGRDLQKTFPSNMLIYPQAGSKIICMEIFLKDDNLKVLMFISGTEQTTTSTLPCTDWLLYSAPINTWEGRCKPCSLFSLGVWMQEDEWYHYQDSQAECIISGFWV